MAYTAGNSKEIPLSNGGKSFWRAIYVDQDSTVAAADAASIPVVNYSEKMLVLKRANHTSGSSVITVDYSIDQSNWHTCDLMYDSSGTDAPVASVTQSSNVTDILILPVFALYMRVAVTITTDGDETVILMARS